MRKLLGLALLLLLPSLARAQSLVTGNEAEKFREYLYAAIPTAAAAGNGRMITVTDAATTACAAGGGTIRCVLRSTGSAWEIMAVVGGTGGASLALDNLASVAINTSLISDTNNTDDLGSSGIKWRTGYFGTSLISPLFASSTGDVADAGAIRLLNNEKICFEANPTGTDGCILFNTSNQFAFDAPIVGTGSASYLEFPSDAVNTTGTANTGRLGYRDDIPGFWFSTDGAAGLNANSAGLTEKVVELVAFDFTTDTATGDGKFYFVIPSTLNGMNLVSVAAQVITAGTTNTTDIQIARCATAASGNACSGTVADMLSTKMTIDSGENSTATAATPAVINASNDDVATGQIIRVDVDAVSTTAAKGLLIILIFRLP